MTHLSSLLPFTNVHHVYINEEITPMLVVLPHFVMRWQSEEASPAERDGVV